MVMSGIMKSSFFAISPFAEACRVGLLSCFQERAAGCKDACLGRFDWGRLGRGSEETDRQCEDRQTV